MTPFENWFSSDWQKAMRKIPNDAVLSSSMTIQTASWDRKAAYLLWVERGRPNAAWVDQVAPAFAAKPPAELDDDLAGLLG